MSVVLASAFRTAVPLLDRYFRQITALAEALQERGDSLRLVLGEGDSIDRSRDELRARASSLERLIEWTLIDCAHGGPAFGSVEHPQRFRQLAYVGNRLLEAAAPSAHETLILIECDLVWEASTMLQLVDRAVGRTVTAPRVLTPIGTFYDTWAFRTDGRHFSPHPPFHAQLAGWPVDRPFPVESAGSCLAIPGSLAREARYSPEDVIRGLCRSLRAQGASIVMLPWLAVEHP